MAYLLGYFFGVFICTGLVMFLSYKVVGFFSVFREKRIMAAVVAYIFSIIFIISVMTSALDKVLALMALLIWLCLYLISIIRVPNVSLNITNRE